MNKPHQSESGKIHNVANTIYQRIGDGQKWQFFKIVSLLKMRVYWFKSTSLSERSCWSIGWRRTEAKPLPCHWSIYVSLGLNVSAIYCDSLNAKQ